MTDQPDWKSQFPVRQSAEHDVSRRQFAKVACCSALAVGAAWAMRDKLLPLPAATAPKLVARVTDVPVGGSRLFRYPTEDHPAILVRLGESEFAAGTCQLKDLSTGQSETVSTADSAHAVIEQLKRQLKQ